MNAGLPVHFLLLFKKSTNGCFFLSFLLQSIKQRFEQTLYMIYCSIQNVLAIGIGYKGEM